MNKKRCYSAQNFRWAKGALVMVIVLRSAQLLPLPVTHLRAGGLQKKACSYTVLYEYLGILIIIMLNCL